MKRRSYHCTVLSCLENVVIFGYYKSTLSFALVGRAAKATKINAQFYAARVTVQLAQAALLHSPSADADGENNKPACASWTVTDVGAVCCW